MNILQYIIQACFTGFGITSILWIVLRFFERFRNDPNLSKFDAAAIVTIQWISILYTIPWAIEIGAMLFTNSENATALQQRFTGPYGFAMYVMAFMYLILAVLLTIKTVRRLTILRLAIALLYILNFERFVIIVTSLHRDYLPGSWTMFGGYSVFGYVYLELTIKTILFLICVLPVYFIRRKRSILASGNPKF